MEETEKNGEELRWYLRELRKKHDYSQEYVAAKLNIRRQTYSHYETGRIKPPVSTLYRIASLYGIQAESLLELAAYVKLPLYMQEQEAAVPSEKDENPNRILASENAEESAKLMREEDMEAYLDYMENPFNRYKLQYLDSTEKYLIYYFENLDTRNREAALTIMKALFER